MFFALLVFCQASGPEFKPFSYEQQLAEYQIEMQIKENPSNEDLYFQAAKLYAKGNNSMWTFFYGLVFLQISENPQKAKEMRELVASTLQENLIWGDSKAVQLSSDGYHPLANIEKDDSMAVMKEMTKHFEIMFEQVMSYAFFGVMESGNHTWPSAQSHHAIWVAFFDLWTGNAGWHSKFPNFVLDELNIYKSKGVLDVFIWWLIQDIYPKEFQGWLEKGQNKLKLDAMIRFRKELPPTEDLLKLSTRTAMYGQIGRVLNPPKQ